MRVVNLALNLSLRRERTARAQSAISYQPLPQLPPADYPRSAHFMGPLQYARWFPVDDKNSTMSHGPNITFNVYIPIKVRMHLNCNSCTIYSGVHPDVSSQDSCVCYL